MERKQDLEKKTQQIEKSRFSSIIKQSPLKMINK